VDVDVLFAGCPVTDIAASTGWYRRFFGRDPDVVVHPEEVMWHASDTAWLYVVVDPDRAGRALVTVSVADLDSTVAELAGRGLDPAPATAVGSAGRRSVLLDPDGNRLSVIEVTGA
jgi:hypothetical protein